MDSETNLSRAVTALDIGNFRNALRWLFLHIAEQDRLIQEQGVRISKFETIQGHYNGVQEICFTDGLDEDDNF